MRVKTAFCILHSAFCICLGASGFLVAVVGAGEVDAVAYTQPTNADAFISSTNFMASGVVTMIASVLLYWTTLLHKSSDGRGSPFPRRIYPTAFVTGMPRAV
jgi:hypothetical protein